MNGTIDIDALEAGPELDALVAERIMGWHSRLETIEGVSFFGNPVSRQILYWYTEQDELLPLGATDFSGDIGAAWLVVEKIPMLLLPIEVYPDERSWRSGRDVPIEIWWLAAPMDSLMGSLGAYKPIKEYITDWSRSRNHLEESLAYDTLSPTPALAICKAALAVVQE